MGQTLLGQLKALFCPAKPAGSAQAPPLLEELQLRNFRHWSSMSKPTVNTAHKFLVT